MRTTCPTSMRFIFNVRFQKLKTVPLTFWTLWKGSSSHDIGRLELFGISKREWLYIYIYIYYLQNNNIYVCCKEFMQGKLVCLKLHIFQINKTKGQTFGDDHMTTLFTLVNTILKPTWLTNRTAHSRRIDLFFNKSSAFWSRLYSSRD